MPDSIVGKEFLPNTHIEKITYQEIENGANIQVEIAIYDYKERTWSMDSKFTGYLSIDLVYLAKKDHIELVKKGETTLKNMFPLQTGNGALITISYSNLAMSDVNIDNVDYKKFKKIITIPMPRNYENLSFFANTSMNIQDLKDNEGLNLGYTSHNYNGPITGEDVIRDSQHVETSNVFTDENGGYWAGPVHEHPESGYMEGSIHRDVAHKKLTVDTEVPNSKVQFLSPLAYSSTELNTTEDAVSQNSYGVDLMSSTSPVTVSRVKKPIYQQDFVQDTFGNISGTFITDLRTLSISESRIAAIMYRYSRSTFNDIVSNMNIENIKINRHRIGMRTYLNRFNLRSKKFDLSKPTLIAKSFNNKNKIKEKTMYKISASEKLSVQPKKIKALSKKKIFDGTETTRDVIEQGQKIGSVKQLNLTLPKNLRAVSFTDFQIKSILGSEYGFSVDMQMKDDFLIYVKTVLKELTSFSYKLENFTNLLVAKNAFDGEKFKISFLTEYYSQYGIEVSPETGAIVSDIDIAKLENIFIFKAFELLKRSEQLCGIKSRATSLLSSFNLFSTTPDRMNKAIKYYNRVISYFKKTYDINIEKNYGKTLTKAARKDSPVIKKTIALEKTYTKPLMPKIGFNYVSQDNDEGPKTLSLNIFKKRAETEKNKFFKNLPSAGNPFLNSLSGEEKKSFVDLSENIYKHFSPSKFFFGSKEVPTTSLNPEGMDVDFFNNFKIARAVASLTEGEDHSPNDKEEQESFYIDSRNYLGDDTKFNRALLTTLRKNPNKLRKIRKVTRLLDRKLLRSKGKKLSIDSFDLTSKNNLVNKLFKKDMKKVPIQLKALALLKTDSTNFDVNNLEFDPLSNPQTDEVIRQNFLNIGKVEYLDGFEMKNGLPMLNKPIFKEITPKDLEQLSSKNVLCQIKNTNFDNLTIDDSLNFQVFDKVFTLESSEEDQMDIGETQQLSEDVNEMTQIFTETILSPVFYSSNIIIQNGDNASIVEPLRVDSPAATTRTAPVTTTRTTPVTTSVNVAPRSTIGGGY